MNRRTVLAIVAAVAVISAGLGWVAGQRIKSPAEVAAEAEPPTASLITVPVEERELSTTVVIRGQVEFDDAAEIPVNPSASGATIITAVPKVPGDQLLEGDVAIEVASRPLFVLEGELPVFRPLGPGVEGPDVRQLEEALVRLGFSVGVVDEVYDNGTEEGVTELYRSAGYSPNEPTTDELDQLEQARQRVRSANESLRVVKSSSNSGGVPESVRLEANQSVLFAEQDLIDAAQRRDQEVAAATAVRDGAVDDLAAAQTALAEAETDAERVAAETRVAELEAFIPTAEAVLAEVIVLQARNVDAASTNLAIAKARRSETFAQYSADTGAAESIRAAEDEVRNANVALAKLDAGIGTSFPSNELLFLPELPREVQRVNVKTGDIPQGSAMTVTGSGLVIRSSVSVADRPLIREDVEGVMEDPNLGISVRVRVVFVADTPGGPNAGTDRYAVRLEAIDDVPDEALNQNLRVTLPFESTNGAVLAVPLAALSAGADGTSRVQVERADGTVETVSVTTGLLARSVGLVEIIPVDGELEAGDRVVVGRDSGADTTDDDGNSEDGGNDGEGS